MTQLSTASPSGQPNQFGRLVACLSLMFSTAMLPACTQLGGDHQISVHASQSAPSSRLTGKVIQICHVDRELYLTINLGESDGMKEGVKVIVHNGDTYLGSGVILATRNEASFGQFQVPANVKIQLGNSIAMMTEDSDQPLGAHVDSPMRATAAEPSPTKAVVSDQNRIEELESQNELLLQNVKYLKEDLIGLRTQYEELRIKTKFRAWESQVAKEMYKMHQEIMKLERANAALRLGLISHEKKPPPKPAHDGKITLSFKTDGKVIIHINRGFGNSQIRIGTKVLIHRGDQFLGAMVVSLIGDKESAGILKLVDGVSVRAGDSVHVMRQTRP